MPSPDVWTIKPGDVDPNTNGVDLVGCRIAIIRDANGFHYQFQGPGGVHVTTPGSQLPALPFTFPMFSASLAGPTPLNWYITVHSLSAGKNGDNAKGVWHNTLIDGGDTDTWHAQAGVGEEPGDDIEKEAAASASTNS